MRDLAMRIRNAILSGVLLTVGAGDTALADSSVMFGVSPELIAGAQALQRGQYEEGIALTQSGLEQFVTSEDRAAGLSNLCAGFIALRKYDIAVVHCSASLELHPRWQAYSNRALAYLSKGLVRLARRDCQDGLSLNPEGEPLLRVRALVEEAVSRRPLRDEPTT